MHQVQTVSDDGGRTSEAASPKPRDRALAGTRRPPRSAAPSDDTYRPAPRARPARLSAPRRRSRAAPARRRSRRRDGPVDPGLGRSRRSRSSAWRRTRPCSPAPRWRPTRPTFVSSTPSLPTRPSQPIAPTSSRARSRSTGWSPGRCSPRLRALLRAGGVFAAYDYDVPPTRAPGGRPGVLGALRGPTRRARPAGRGARRGQVAEGRASRADPRERPVPLHARAALPQLRPRPTHARLVGLAAEPRRAARRREPRSRRAFRPSPGGRRPRPLATARGRWSSATAPAWASSSDARALREL